VGEGLDPWSARSDTSLVRPVISFRSLLRLDRPAACWSRSPGCGVLVPPAVPTYADLRVQGDRPVQGRSSRSGVHGGTGSKATNYQVEVEAVASQQPYPDHISLIGDEADVYEAIATLEYLGRHVGKAEIVSATGLDDAHVRESLDALTKRDVLVEHEEGSHEVYEPAYRGWSAAPEQAAGPHAGSQHDQGAARTVMHILTGRERKGRRSVQ